MLFITRLSLCQHVPGCVNKVVVFCLRYAITVWYFDSVERAEAKRRFRDLTGTNTPRASPPPSLTRSPPLHTNSSSSSSVVQLSRRAAAPADCEDTSPPGVGPPHLQERSAGFPPPLKASGQAKRKDKKKTQTVCWRERPACCERRCHLTRDAFR